jgi:hypothetical protein
MVTGDFPLICTSCGEERLLDVDRESGAWACGVCGQHGPRAGAAAAVAEGLQALLSAVVQRHLAPVPWQVVAIAPLAQWPRSLQRELTATLGATNDAVVLVLERVPQ